jgi:hypothetical protein
MAGEQAAPFQLSDENYQQIITAKSDAILLTPAFGMRHTRSPEIVRNEQEYSALKAKEAAGAASEVDRKRLKDLNKILHPLLDGLGVE